MKRNQHRYPGARRRHRVPEPSEEVAELLSPPPDPDLHAKLRVALADGPLTFGQLRRSYEFSPMVLLQDCIGRFPEVYVEGIDAEGHPTIGLRAGAPPLDEQLDRQALLDLIGAAGANGVFLTTLYRHSGLSSSRIEKLLVDVPNLERVLRNKRPLFRFVVLPTKEPEPTPLEELERVRDELLTVLADTTRNSQWLVDQCGFERGKLLAVLSKFSSDFVVETIDTGVGSYLEIRSAAVAQLRSPAHEQPIAASEEFKMSNVRHSSGPEPLLEEIFDDEQLATMKFKPACVGMASRRNDRRVMRGDRMRVRRPLVKL
jgi:hypothetical protein